VTRRLDIEATADAVAAARTRPAETTDLPTSVLAPKTRCTRWVGCDDHDGVKEDENSSTSSSPRDGGRGASARQGDVVVGAAGAKEEG
jgi:hypothetical protein